MFYLFIFQIISQKNIKDNETYQAFKIIHSLFSSYLWWSSYRIYFPKYLLAHKLYYVILISMNGQQIYFSKFIQRITDNDYIFMNHPLFLYLYIFQYTITLFFLISLSTQKCIMKKCFYFSVFLFWSQTAHTRLY